MFITTTVIAFFTHVRIIIMGITTLIGEPGRRNILHIDRKPE